MKNTFNPNNSALPENQKRALMVFDKLHDEIFASSMNLPVNQAVIDAYSSFSPSEMIFQMNRLTYMEKSLVALIKELILMGIPSKHFDVFLADSEQFSGMTAAEIYEQNERKMAEMNSLIQRITGKMH